MPMWFTYRAQSIKPCDIDIAIREEKVVLLWRNTGQRILPRITNAHNTTNPQNLYLYKLLAELQYQDVEGWVGWDWGRLKGLSFLPRLTLDGVIVSRARWRLNHEDISTLNNCGDGRSL